MSRLAYDEALTGHAAQGFRAEKNEHLDCATGSQSGLAHSPGVVDLDTDDKAYSNMRARAAMAKCSLYRLADGGFLVTRIGWGMTRELPSLCAVAGLLRQLGGAA